MDRSLPSMTRSSSESLSGPPVYLDEFMEVWRSSSADL